MRQLRKTFASKFLLTGSILDIHYLSDYRFAIFIRIAVQSNTKAFLSVQFARELGKTGNNETRKKDQQQKGKETRTCYEVTKLKVEVHVKKEHRQRYFSRKSTFLGGGRESGDSKGRVINKKHTMLGESNLICL